MQMVYAANDAEQRKIRFLYHQSGIEKRYSVLPDYSCSTKEWKFYPQTEGLEPFPSLEQRMAIYHEQAALLSVAAIKDCLAHGCSAKEITHLITVSCTGMSAPGLDLQLMDLLDLDKNIFRTSINFMGCYAALHGLKIADTICKTDANAKVLIVCTELCTLHFQREATSDNITSSLLFGDGSAAVLLMPSKTEFLGAELTSFYAEVVPKGRSDMAWELSSSGFLMTLSGYVPELIEEDFKAVVDRSLKQSGLGIEDITDWCMHPGGKRILQAIEGSVGLSKQALQPSYEVLRDYGNMSSASILFVLKKLLSDTSGKKNIFAAAFGPGLTVETFTASL